MSVFLILDITLTTKVTKLRALALFSLGCDILIKLCYVVSGLYQLITLLQYRQQMTVAKTAK